MKQVTLLLAVLMMGPGFGGPLALHQETTTTPILDESIRAVHAESLEFPPLARQANRQGIVVVRAKLDKAGHVVSSVAVSGDKLLIPACLSNSMKWRFQPNSSNEVVIAYDFRIEGSCLSPPCGSLFNFRPPNIAIIIAPTLPVEI
jgi:hypothetical protein